MLALLQSGDLIDLIKPKLSTAPADLLLVAAVDLHNAGQYRLHDIFETPQFKALADRRLLAAQYFFSDAIPLLTVSVPEMLAFVVGLESPPDASFSNPVHRTALALWLKEDLARAREVVALARTGDSEAIKALALALRALADAALSRGFVTAFTDERRGYGLWALSDMAHPSAADRDATVAMLAGLVAGSCDDSLRASTLDTVIGVFKTAKLPLTPAALDVARSALAGAGDQTLHRAAQALWADRPTLDKNLLNILLPPLTALNPANAGTIGSLDMGLSQLVDAGFTDEAIDFVADFFKAAGGAMRLGALDMFVPTLFRNSAAFDRALVTWLLAGDHALASGLLSQMHHLDDAAHARTIDLSGFGLTPERRISLCLRAISYLFIYPVLAASMVVSVRRSIDGKFAQATEDLLFDPLLTSYGDKLLAYLEAIPKADPAYPTVRRALRRRKAYFEGLRAVGFIKELAPPERHVQAAHDLRQDEMRRAHEASQQQSPLLGAISRSVVLYGRSTVSYQYVADGKRTLNENHMHTFSTSWSEARALHLDPFGLEEQMLIYRTAPIAP